jgi:hypothetical protein
VGLLVLWTSVESDIRASTDSVMGVRPPALSVAAADAALIRAASTPGERVKSTPSTSRSSPVVPVMPSCSTLRTGPSHQPRIDMASSTRLPSASGVVAAAMSRPARVSMR